MDLPDRKCVELDDNQALIISHQLYSTRTYSQENNYEVGKAERIVIHHDPAGHMVRVKDWRGWREFVNHPYQVVPSDDYESSCCHRRRPCGHKTGAIKPPEATAIGQVTWRIDPLAGSLSNVPGKNPLTVERLREAIRALDDIPLAK